ncbi:hypothetical protein [Streptomyces calvus]|uniref:hypothetical protein n=1 Tax=Streptomyces calvus TaxID=67282 RepID=UPI003713FABE
MTTSRRGLLGRWRAWRDARRARRDTRPAVAQEPKPDWQSPVSVVEPVRPEWSVALASDDEPLLLEAKGGVFQFEVFAHFSFRSNEISVEHLRERADASLREARADLLRMAWPLARTCEAGDPVAAEDLINSHIAQGWCYEQDGARTRCRPTVRVRIDPALRDRMQPSQLDKQEMKEALELGLLKAAHARELTETWLDVFARLEGVEEGADELTPVQRQFLVPFAATLADREFAGMAQAVRAARRKGTDDLANVLKKASEGHEKIGMFEFANAYDKALNAFSQQMGLTPFSWIEDGTHSMEGAE